jgi:hypothetical protein
MTRTELEALIRAGESEMQEFKQTTGQRTDAARTLCGMLNGRGGRVFFGVQPEIEDGGGCVTVRFRPRRYQPPQRIGHDLTSQQQAVLAVLAGGHRLALRDIVGQLQGETRSVREDLALLKRLGLVNSDGHGRGARWFLSGGTG